MNRKALLGATAATLSVAALYGVSRTGESPSSSKADSPKEPVVLRTNYDAGFSANNSTAVAQSPPLERRVPSLAEVVHEKLPRVMPLSIVSWDSEWDRDRTAAALTGGGDADQCQTASTQAPTATRNLFLIRHGQYHTQQPRDQDQTLTPLGREQLDLTGSRLRELGYGFDRLVASTMTRARESAAIVHGHFPQLSVECEPLLEEGAPAKPEPPVNYWTEDQFCRDGPRIERAFKKYFHRASPDVKKDSYEIVVCHGNVIRYCVCRALQIPPEAWLRLGIDHGSITWISIKPSGHVSLRVYGSSGHMPPNKVSAV